MADRRTWEERLGKQRFKMVREMIRWVQSWDRGIAPHYEKKYISLTRRERRDNFVKFWLGMPPAKEPLQLQPILDYSDEFEDRLKQAGLNVMGYRRDESRYRIGLTPGDFPDDKPILKELLRMAYARATIVRSSKHYREI